MYKDDVINAYFNWLYNTVCEGRFSDAISYRKLLMYLHSVEFKYTRPKDDKNRAADGVYLRYRFSLEYGDYGYISECLEGPCSVLEMMVALAIRCEENIMDDPRIGNRIGQWFWEMVVSLGLGSMSDDRFEIGYVASIVEQFLRRDYEPNGRGGLFTIKNCKYDLRYTDIWTQMCYFLNSIM